MAVTLQIKTGTEANIIAGALAIGELGLSTDTQTLYGYNGITKFVIGRTIVDTHSNITTYSGLQGRFFYATDTTQLYVYNGSEWLSIGGGGGITLGQLTTTSGDIINQLMFPYSLGGGTPFSIYTGIVPIDGGGP